ncbi:MAG: UDP-2,4-diacetamido-2,4,6-trideoxy-beta-L-altropyranose hydrolase [Pseudomonadota bacterium]
MSPRSVIFRTDASVQIGSGHVMRCLTLAEALRERGAECRFICRELEGNLLEQIRHHGFAATGLPIRPEDDGRADSDTGRGVSTPAGAGLDWAADAAQTKVSAGGTAVDWLIVDHYALDARWEQALRPLCHNLMVVDDLADRQHDCDILLDQNYYRNQDQRYRGLLPDRCVTLLGPGYVLLRPEFGKARRQLRMRDGNVKRILIFFGGSDPTNLTRQALMALAQLNKPDIQVDVIVGPSNPNRHSIEVLCAELPGTTYHCNISNMAELVSRADLGIGAGGAAMWERCYLGLPTITVVSADNQLRTTEDVAHLGAIEYLGRSDLAGVDGYARAIADLLASPQRVKRISEDALAVVPERTTAAVVDGMWNVLQPASGRSSSGNSCAAMAEPT